MLFSFGLLIKIITLKTKIMKKIIFYCLTASVLLLASCKKTGLSDVSTLSGYVNPNTVIVHFNQEVLDYIQLPVNRYFIYKDSATGSIDSVKVTQSVIETEFSPATSGYPGSPALYTDVYKLTLTKFQTLPPTNQPWFQGTARCASFAGLVSAIFIDSNINFLSGQSNLPAFQHPFTSYGSYYYTYIATLTIEGTTYSAVHCFSSSNGLSSTDINYQASLFYWVKGIGIIKKEIRTYNSVKTSLLLRYG